MACPVLQWLVTYSRLRGACLNFSGRGPLFFSCSSSHAIWLVAWSYRCFPCFGMNGPYILWPFSYQAWYLLDPAPVYISWWLLLQTYSDDVMSQVQESSIAILIFQLRNSIKNHQRTFPFYISHNWRNVILRLYHDKHMGMSYHHDVSFDYFTSFIYKAAVLFFLYLGVKTIWDLHSHFLCARWCSFATKNTFLL